MTEPEKLYRVGIKRENLFSSKRSPLEIIKAIRPTRGSKKLALKAMSGEVNKRPSQYKDAIAAQSHRVAVFAFITDELEAALNERNSNNILLAFSRLGRLAYAWNHAAHKLHTGEVGSLTYAESLFEPRRWSHVDYEGRLPPFPERWKERLSVRMAEMVLGNN